jgi:hypothetical protein
VNELQVVRSPPSVHRFGVGLALGPIAAGLILAGAVLAATTGWKVEPSPNPSPDRDHLNGVTATSSTKAWAVGWYHPRKNGAQTLIESWNGKAWNLQPSANPNSHADHLNGVVATSSTNAWAVGSYKAGGGFHTLIEHWNGRAWKIEPSPNLAGSSGAFLYGVAASSSTNAWAVGYYDNGTAAQSLIERRHGTAWTVVPSPSPGGSSGTVLTAVTATSSTNAWAVGWSGTQTLVEHWDGTAWTVVPSPNPGSERDQLFGVAATSATNAWAVGYYSSLSPDTQSLIEHWDGKAWTVESSPGPGVLRSVAATSSTNAWAVGASGFQRYVTLIEHWNGKNWKVQPSPNPGPPSRHSVNKLDAVAATPTNAWAVGYYSTRRGLAKTLIEHRNG